MATIIINNSEDSYNRRNRRTHDDDGDDDRSQQREQRRARRTQKTEDDEDDSRSSRRSRREAEDEEEDEKPRRGRRDRNDDDDDSSSRVKVRTVVSTSSAGSSKPGATLGAMAESKRKRVQQAIIDSMFKYAESKYGKKRKPKAGGKGRSAKEEYDLYLKSVKARVKTAEDKLNVLLKQQTDIDAKVNSAQDEKSRQSKVLRDAEHEKDDAEREGRDPAPPSSWVPPPLPNQGNKKAKANFANLVMSASSASWDEKFAAMKAKKGEDKQPDWMKKSSSRKRDDLLLSVGKKRPEKGKKDHQEPAWGSVGLKKSGKAEQHHHVEKTKPEWSKKTHKGGKAEENHDDDDDESGRRRQRRNRRRDADDSD